MVRWINEENYELCAAVLKEYVVKKSSKSVRDFVDELNLPRHSSASVKMAVQNVKAIIDDKGIENTLEVGALKNSSRSQREQLERACIDLGIL